ncbi:MAG: 2OG-Fe(II) oxygenase [Nitrospirae bacterium]|nr:2OG-Fe(II) oxygenase [Nitrospirota bacterium]
MDTLIRKVEEEIERGVTVHHSSAIREQYNSQGEFIAIDDYFSISLIDEMMSEVRSLQSHTNRNYIPSHKKGGSISYYTVKQFAPTIVSLYTSPRFKNWLSTVSGVSLQLCPEDDPHACALYFYTEPGDHIGYHYDTSYYRGARYTVLIGLVDRSTSKLACRLHTRNPLKEVTELSLSTGAGSFIFFNGDQVHHAVTPLGENEERIVLTLQYVTDPHMNFLKRWFSNLKDAVGYFGLPALVRRPSSRG